MDITTLLIVAVVCVAVGYLGGVLVSTLRSDRSAEEPQSEAQEPADAYVVEARFLRDRPGDPLQVEMNGKIYGNSLELAGPQRDHLEDLILEIKTFLGFTTAISTASADTQVKADSAEALDEPKPASTIPIVSVPSPLAAAPVKIHSPAPASSAARGGPKSMVGQIDDILQEKMAETPFAGQKIRLAESPTHGVVVMVGKELFPGIDEVPDPEIRGLIRQAVAEWELRAK